MKNIPFRIALAVIALVLPAACRGPGEFLQSDSDLSLFSDSCTTRGCHSSVLSSAMLHTPARDGKCALCHEQRRPDHPDGEGWEFAPVMEKRPIICLDCHLANQDKPVFDHKPSRMGHCLACHESHGSELPALAKRDIEGLCLYCHRDLAARLERVSVRHPALEETCVTTCHTPHRSENRQLLRQPEEILCVSCHEAAEDCLPGTGSRGSYPSAACTGCHYAHGSILPKMLKK